MLLGPIPQGPGKTPLPKPTLNEKVWLSTIELWKKEQSLGGNPPGAVRLGLSQLETLDKVDQTKLADEEKKRHLDKEIATLTALETAFATYEPLTGAKQEIEGADRVIGAYADLAGSRAELAQQARDALDKEAP